MLWILINIHDCTKSLTVHTSGLYVCTGKRRKILLGNEWILQLQFFFPPWIIPINFNFSLAALDRQDFPILLREIGQECCCHLQTQDYICNTHTHTFLTHIHKAKTRVLEGKLSDPTRLRLQQRCLGCSAYIKRNMRADYV